MAAYAASEIDSPTPPRDKSRKAREIQGIADLEHRAMMPENTHGLARMRAITRTRFLAMAPLVWPSSPSESALLALLTACNTNMKHTPAADRRLHASHSVAVPQPPVAAKKPYQVVSPNGTREDEYYWLRDDKRENAEMLAYVKAENAYADAMLAHIKALEDKVYNEIIGRLQQDDSTVPYLMNGYWYFRRFETGKEYPIYSRRADSAERARRNPAERQ